MESRPTDDHVERHYGDSYFWGGGAGYHDYLDERELLIATGQRYGALLARHRPPGTLLDVGSAAGFLIEGFTRSGWSCEGLEPNERLVEHANSTFGSVTHAGTLETFAGSGRTFDAVSMIQVAPHFYDLRSALSNARRLTAPGGLWLFELWDVGSLTARLLGEGWHEFNPPTVLHWFSRRSILELAEQMGMEPVASGRPRKRIRGSHLRSALRHNFPKNALGRAAGAVSDLVPDGLELPYPGDDVFWALFRRHR